MDVREQWEEETERFRRYLRLERGMSENTALAYCGDILRFSQFVLERDSSEGPWAVDGPTVSEYAQSMFSRHLSKATQNRMLSSVAAFYRYGMTQGRIGVSPARFVSRPKASRHLPDTLSVAEIDAMISAIDTDSPLGLRNRAILEMLYSAGIRVSELTSIRLSDIHLSDGVISVIGKGDKQRLVPLSGPLRDAIEAYLPVRPVPEGNDRGNLFLNRLGRPMSRVMVFDIVRKAAETADIRKTVSPHTFRHSFATHLLEGGAGIRQVQDMLGHESITTTEIYTHLDTRHMEKTLRENHPLQNRPNGKTDGTGTDE